MKKLATILLVFTLALSLVACSNGGGESKTMADGTYTAVADDAYANGDGHGWKDTLTVTYKDGVITSAEYDSINTETGQKKSELSADEYPMPVPVSTWIPQLNDAVVSAGSAANIDTVSGATSSTNMAKWLLLAIEDRGEPGKTIEVTISA